MTHEAHALVAALAQRRVSRARVLMLVAHQDDEVLGASVALRHLPRTRLVHATDGSGGDVAATAARMKEVMGALAALEVAPTLAPCGLPDGSLIDHAAALAGALAAWLPDTDAVITHAFEGGHPDHDACALAAQLACGRELARGREIALVEFAIYAAAEGSVVTNAFPMHAASPATVLRLNAEEAARKAVALRAFTSQQHVTDRFPLRQEAIRIAPEHDFTAPRDPAGLLFARNDAPAEKRWREAAARAFAG